MSKRKPKTSAEIEVSITEAPVEVPGPVSEGVSYESLLEARRLTEQCELDVEDAQRRLDRALSINTELERIPAVQIARANLDTALACRSDAYSQFQALRSEARG